MGIQCFNLPYIEEAGRYERGRRRPSCDGLVVEADMK